MKQCIAILREAQVEGGAEDLKLRSLRWLVVEPSIELGITGM